MSVSDKARCFHPESYLSDEDERDPPYVGNHYFSELYRSFQDKIVEARGRHLSVTKAPYSPTFLNGALVYSFTAPDSPIMDYMARIYQDFFQAVANHEIYNSPIEEFQSSLAFGLTNKAQEVFRRYGHDEEMDSDISSFTNARSSIEFHLESLPDEDRLPILEQITLDRHTRSDMAYNLSWGTKEYVLNTQTGEHLDPTPENIYKTIMEPDLYWHQEPNLSLIHI